MVLACSPTLLKGFATDATLVLIQAPLFCLCRTNSMQLLNRVHLRSPQLNSTEGVSSTTGVWPHKWDLTTSKQFGPMLRTLHWQELTSQIAQGAAGSCSSGSAAHAHGLPLCPGCPWTPVHKNTQVYNSFNSHPTNTNISHWSLWLLKPTSSIRSPLLKWQWSGANEACSSLQLVVPQLVSMGNESACLTGV